MNYRRSIARGRGIWASLAKKQEEETKRRRQREAKREAEAKKDK